MTFVYDWQVNGVTSQPFGANPSKLTRPAACHVPIQYELGYESDLYDELSGPRDIIGFTIKRLVP